MIYIVINSNHAVGQYSETEYFCDVDYLDALHYIGAEQLGENFMDAQLYLKSDSQDSDVILVDEYPALAVVRKRFKWFQDIKEKLAHTKRLPLRKITPPGRRPGRGQKPPA